MWWIDLKSVKAATQSSCTEWHYWSTHVTGWTDTRTYVPPSGHPPSRQSGHSQGMQWDHLHLVAVGLQSAQEGRGGGGNTNGSPCKLSVSVRRHGVVLVMT